MPLFILIGILAYLFAGSYRKFSQIVERTVVDIEINGALDTSQAPVVGMLPEFPRSFILYLLYIIVSYPIRIAVKS